MSISERFEPAVSLMREIAPADWDQLCIVYRYFDAVADLKLFCKEKIDSDWDEVGVNRYDLMDFFDAYREEVFPTLDEPWSVLELYVDGSGSVKIQHAYGDPKILDRTKQVGPSS